MINCNLQRLDGPVRGNGKIIQELESIFRGAGWNVIKVVWGDDWDTLLAKDTSGLLAKRMNEVVDGQYQKYTGMPGSYIREHFFGKYPELLKLVENYSDEKLEKLRRGGHEPEKVYAAYRMATELKNGKPTVILAKTVKGYGLGEAGEGRNIAHNQKKMNEDELLEFRTRFAIPISDEEVGNAPFYKPPENSAEINTCASVAQPSAVRFQSADQPSDDRNAQAGRVQQTDRAVERQRDQHHVRRRANDDRALPRQENR